MANEIRTFNQLFVEYLLRFGHLITPCGICDLGYAIILKRLGRPSKVYKQPGLYFKIPFFDTFDKVNLKTQIHFLNAHSVKCNTDKLIPYNLTIDAQVEFKIINPMIIYYIDTFDDGNREPIRIFVDNEVHRIIDNVLKSDVLGDDNIQQLIDAALIKRNTLISDDDFIKKSILIERIIISAFDYNLSIRHAQ